MRTLLVPTLLASLLVVAPASLRAQQPARGTTAPRAALDSAVAGFKPSHVAAVRRLMAVSGVREQFDEPQLPESMKGIPMPPEMLEDIKAINQEYLNWAILEPEFTRAYLETYSEAEATALANFFGTPLGRTMLKRAPQLNTKMQVVVGAHMRLAMPKITEKVMQRAQQRALDP